jgi:hypothetical protein
MLFTRANNGASRKAHAKIVTKPKHIQKSVHYLLSYHENSQLNTELHETASKTKEFVIFPRVANKFTLKKCKIENG